MTISAEGDTSIPANTVEVARAAFPKGNLYLTLRDKLGDLYRDQTFASWIAHTGRPAEAPGCLAWVTVLQFIENLTDRQAAEAVRSRIDWKYLLGLDLTDSGFDFTLLSDFRQRLLTGGSEELLLNELLRRAQALGVLKARGRQRTDSTHILAAIRTLNRLECVGETLRHALNELSRSAPEWVQTHVPVEWVSRYGQRIEQYRLPKTLAKRQEWAETTGWDGLTLLSACYAPEAPAVVRTHSSVEVLRQVWLQNYYYQEAEIHWRQAGNLPPSDRMIQSPYDVEARFSRKRDTTWVGFKSHVTETCDPEQPYLFTQVQTTPATRPDEEALAPIQAALAAKALLPTEHLVDAGYTTATGFVTSHTQYQIELIGPVSADHSWQAKQGQGFDVACFAIDWQAHTVQCPQGQISAQWHERPSQSARPVIDVTFASTACQACVRREACVHGVGPRHLQLQAQPLFTALQTARQRQTTDVFKEQYAARAGVEASLSQAVRAFGFRCTRYIGLAKTHLQQVLTATAINLVRLADWFESPEHCPPKPSPFAAAMASTP